MSARVTQTAQAWISRHQPQTAGGWAELGLYASALVSRSAPSWIAAIATSALRHTESGQRHFDRAVQLLGVTREAVQSIDTKDRARQIFSSPKVQVKVALVAAAALTRIPLLGLVAIGACVMPFTKWGQSVEQTIASEYTRAEQQIIERERVPRKQALMAALNVGDELNSALKKGVIHHLKVDLALLQDPEIIQAMRSKGLLSDKPFFISLMTHAGAQGEEFVRAWVLENHTLSQEDALPYLKTLSDHVTTKEQLTAFLQQLARKGHSDLLGSVEFVIPLVRQVLPGMAHLTQTRQTLALHEVYQSLEGQVEAESFHQAVGAALDANHPWQTFLPVIKAVRKVTNPEELVGFFQWMAARNQKEFLCSREFLTPLLKQSLLQLSSKRQVRMLQGIYQSYAGILAEHPVNPDIFHEAASLALSDQNHPWHQVDLRAVVPQADVIGYVQ